MRSDRDHPARPLAAACLVALLASVAAGAGLGDPTEIDGDPVPIWEDTLRARFLGFVTGDYVYAVFCVPGDSTVVLGVGDLGAIYFVAAHPGMEIVLTRQLWRGFVPEAGEGVDQEVFVAARIGGSPRRRGGRTRSGPWGGRRPTRPSGRSRCC